MRRFTVFLLILLPIILMTGCKGKIASLAGGRLLPFRADREIASDTTESPAPTTEPSVDIYTMRSRVTQITEEDLIPREWTLVWSDEFDYQGLPDPEKWGYDTGGSGWGNHELQYYTAGENAYVDGGVLHIEARKESRSGMEYTSARMITKNKGDWLYGRIEVRAKLPDGRGTWPAIWMLPTDWAYGGWPDSGEIDIMEHVGYDPDVIHGTVHTDSFNHRRRTQIEAIRRVEGARQDFHVYAVEWYENKILFFIDGELYHKYSPELYSSRISYKEWPFDRRFHLLLNVAVGGDWGALRGVADDIWPAVMEVDYVRVYEEDEHGIDGH